MSLLDHEFKAVCQRTEQAERRIARHQALVAQLMEKGEPVDTISGSLGAMHAVLEQLRAQRREMAKQLRYRARRRVH